jgi:hypothetical protein
MKHSPLAAFAVGAVALAFVVEIGTLNLGHEFTWFGHVPPAESAWIRYCVLTAAILLVVAAVIYRKRGSTRAR